MKKLICSALAVLCATALARAQQRAITNLIPNASFEFGPITACTAGQVPGPWAMPSSYTLNWTWPASAGTKLFVQAFIGDGQSWSISDTLMFTGQ